MDAGDIATEPGATRAGSGTSGARPARQPRIAVVDDDTLIREGVALRLRDVEVVLAVSSVAAFDEALVGPDDLDVVLLDLRLSEPPGRGVQGRGLEGRGLEGRGVQGRAAVAALAASGHRVLIYTNDRRPLVLAGCLAAGARGLVHKIEPVAALRTAIDVVAAGGHHVSAEVAGLAEVLAHRGLLPTLSPRQVEVLQGRARGESFARIALRLHLSDRTVESYMREDTLKFADYLATHSAADLERDLGLGRDDLLG